jgi:hypothetical protein
MKRNWKLWTGWSLVLFPLAYLVGTAALDIAGIISPAAETVMRTSKAQRWAALAVDTVAMTIPILVGASIVKEQYLARRELVSIK